MGSSWQRWSTCKTYDQAANDQAARKTKSKHFKRFGRTNTVISGLGVQEDMKQNEINVKVKRAPQHTSVNKGVRGVDINKIQEANRIAEKHQSSGIEKIEFELKALTPLTKQSAPESELFLLKEAFSRHFLLGNISLNAIDSILKEMDYFNLEPKKILFDQGDTGMHLFILTKGVLEVKINNEIVSLVSEGNAFGEIALIYSWKRTAKIVSKDEECHLWTIHRDTFHKIMKEISEQTSFIRTNVLRELRVFSFIERDLRNKLSEYMIPMKFTKGDVIIKKGIHETLYIINRGRVKKELTGSFKGCINKVYK
jgi:hypothetical protein